MKPVNNCLQCAAFVGVTVIEGICIMNPPQVINGHVSAYPPVKAEGPGCFQGIPKAAPKKRKAAKPKAAPRKTQSYPHMKGK